MVFIGALGADDVRDDDLGELAVGVRHVPNKVREVRLHLLSRDHFHDEGLDLGLEVLDLTLHSKDVIVGIQNIFLNASTLQALAEFLENLFILVHLIDNLRVVDGDLLHEYLVLIVQLTLPWQNNLFIKLLFKAFDLGLDASVNF